MISRIKSLSLALLLSFFCFVGKAQSHLAFKGIPIDGPMSSFVDELKQTGMDDYYYSSNQLTILKGWFAGIPNTIVVVIGNAHGNVAMVSAMLPIGNDFLEALAKYQSISKNLQKKYAIEPEVKAPSDSIVWTNLKVKHALKNKEDRPWKTSFDMPDGSITAELVYQVVGKEFNKRPVFAVQINYADRINFGKNANPEMDDL